MHRNNIYLQIGSDTPQPQWHQKWTAIHEFFRQLENMRVFFFYFAQDLLERSTNDRISLIRAGSQATNRPLISLAFESKLNRKTSKPAEKSETALTHKRT